MADKSITYRFIPARVIPVGPDYCTICGVFLNDPDDPLTLDCGGDCARCMYDAELGSGDLVGARTHLLVALEALNKLIVKQAEERRESLQLDNT